MLEFILLFVFTAAIFSIVSLHIMEMQNTSIQRNQQYALQDYAYALQNEISLAFTMQIGFSRTIIIPEKVGGNEFDIQIINDNLYVSNNQYQIILPLPPVDGTLSIGPATLERHSDKVVIVQ